jgi:hypothetical protein
MSDFIHSREYLEEGDLVVVNCDTQCNVMLLTDLDFESYRRRDSYHYHGGHFKMFPARIGVPSSGNWNIVLDLGGGQANIRYDFSYIKRNG